MYFDSHYYLQSSVGLEALYYKAAIDCYSEIVS